MKTLSHSSGTAFVASLLLSLLCVGTSSAVVIVSGDGSGNTTAPGDDPGFANVGRMGSGSAVYLGNRWILTVAHLSTGGGTAVFGGTSYGFVPGTNIRLENAPGSGLTGVVDLRMLRLDADPGLPTMPVASAAPAVGDDVVMIGRGRLRSINATNWDIDTVPDPDVWTVVVPPPPSDAEGFTTTNVRTIRWGDNEIDDADLVVNTGFGDTQSFDTAFDAIGMTHEGQAVAGDSGGGVFSKASGSWVLAGIMHSIGTFNGQPANTAVYDNTTNAADLSFYADDINAIVATPEPGSSMLIGLSGLVLALRRRR